MLPDIEIIRINGESENIKDYQGTCLLIVNVASECGFTPQYEQFQSFYDELKDQKERKELLITNYANDKTDER